MARYDFRPAAVLWLTTSFCLLFGLASSGCSQGDIIVDRPEVFTRERLVTRRLQETEFLERKLEEKFVPTIQGYRDTREFSGVMASIAGTFDPLGGAVDVSQKTATLSNADRAEELAKIQHEIELAKKRKELADLSTKDAASNAADSNSGNGSNDSAGSSSGDSQAGSGTGGTSSTISVDDMLKHASLFKDAAKPTLPSPGDIVQSMGQRTHIEADRDELARRDFLHATMRERELDDTHDLFGYTLYTLKFDVTVMPQSGSGDIGNVGLYLSPNSNLPTCDSISEGTNKPEERRRWEELYKTYVAWRNSFEQAIQVESLAFQKKFSAQVLTESEQINFALIAASITPDEPIWETKTAKEIQQSFLTQMSVGSSATKRTDPGDRTIPHYLAAVIAQRYLPLTDKFGWKLRRVDLKDYGVVLMLPPRAGSMEDDQSFRQFRNLIGDLRTTQAARAKATADKTGAGDLFGAVDQNNPSNAYVYSIEPKEQAQNISDVAAAEKLASFVLSARAAIPSSGVDASGYLNAMRNSQERVQALVRSPLVVGYINGEQHFGWVLGPRFKLGDDRRPTFDHTHVQHSLQVSIAVPAWERSIRIAGRYHWGNPKQAQNLWSGQPMDVDLPADPRALTAAFMAKLVGFEAREPKIEPWHGRADSPQVVLSASDKPQKLLIRGTNLWRNPAVFVGDTKASKLEVTPDMKGLLATFEQIPPPPRIVNRAIGNPLEDHSRVDLRVITSGGEDVLRRAVAIVGSASPALPTRAQLANYFVVGKEPISFQVDPGSFPSAFDALSVRLRPADDEHAEWLENVVEPVLETPGKNRIVCPLSLGDKPPAWFVARRELQVELRYRLLRAQEFIRVPLKDRDTFVHFTEEKERQFKLESPASIEFDSNFNVNADAISLSFNSEFAIFGKAYPDAAKGLELILKSEKATHVLPIEITGERLTFKQFASPAFRSILQNVTTKEVYALQVRMGGGGGRTVPVEGPLTVSRKAP